MLTGRKDGTSLLLISFLGLFFELAFIRWLPANVLSIAYFSNVVLISCFLGFGLGCLLTHRRDLLPFLPYLLIVATSLFACFRFLEVVVPTGDAEWIWSGYGDIFVDPPVTLGIVPTLIIVFLLNTIVFIPIGQTMGRLMSAFDPIVGYTINIVGSVLGIVVFAGLSSVGGWATRPTTWFAVGGILTLWFFRGSRRKFIGASLAISAVVTVVHLTSSAEIWSPYYSINTKARDHGTFDVYVNKFLHQHALNFNEQPGLRQKYALPYRLKTPERVLILGAGSGNDVAIAKLEGVPEVWAVEIDPAIARLGRERHPLRPYDQPGVHLVVDDARSFLQRTDLRFDLIVFGTLDSHAVLSGMSAVRLDNFVYTRECFEDAQRLLTDDGIVVLMFSVPSDWLMSKLVRLTASVFSDPAPIIRMGDPFPFNLMAIGGPGLTEEMRSIAGRELGFGTVAPVTEIHDLPSDDWPYLYLAGRSVPRHYVVSIVILVGLSIALIFAMPTGATRRIDLNFLCLGAAFMLLETKSVTTLSLLHGSTWIVNAFVFGAILTMILIANLLVWKLRMPPIHLIYILLLGSLLLNYLLPVSRFLGFDYWTRALGSSILIALPILFAGIVFATLFREVHDIGFAFGSNLIGAVVGGFLEYTSMAIGLNNLYLVAAMFYLVSFLLTARSK